MCCFGRRDERELEILQYIGETKIVINKCAVVISSSLAVTIEIPILV